jgi:hypothetical protein
MKNTTKIFILISSFLTIGCASYTTQIAEVRSEVYAEQYPKALEKLDAMSLAKSEKDKALYLMERGMILYLKKDYLAAAKHWEDASQKIEELYTVSLSKSAASLIVNDSVTDYEGESFEKILLPMFSSVAYFASGNLTGASVEVKKSYNLLKVLNQQSEGKNTYSRDSFLHYISGIIYEAKKDVDGAIIEYREAMQAAANNKKFSSVDEEIFAQALAPLAEFRKRNEILGEIRKRFPKLSWANYNDNKDQGELIVMYENGNVPIKKESDLIIPTGQTVVRVSYPKYQRMSYSNTNAILYVNGNKVGYTDVIQDVGSVAIQSLEDRRVRDIVKMTARLIAKEATARAVGRQFGGLAGLGVSVLGAAVETADTRGWTTLPDKIQIKRHWLKPGAPHRIQVSGGGNSEEVTLTFNPGEKKLIRLRGY